jgi:hypothetical protein
MPVAAREGLEPPTLALGKPCSIRLSYRAAPLGFCIISFFYSTPLFQSPALGGNVGGGTSSVEKVRKVIVNISRHLSAT